jgi:hypothetical protein
MPSPYHQGITLSRMTEVSGYQAWIESEADQRVAETGPLRLDRPLESGFIGVIRTSVSSSWDNAGNTEVVWFSAFTRDGAEYRAERRVLDPDPEDPQP